ncbi:nickel transport protein [Allochromatium warmingii]|uniref:Nickel transport protein n=1 Tax=Allochromatium warmingii TaxID=61595 RepID=A0A1H3DCJ4_ALLWA|nr:carboxypeptidase regulatory-like domain-containing protein [Allochromatium warmingii]SDX64173.1 nickel transport protein [Allochromatium warmingii]
MIKPLSGTALVVALGLVLVSQTALAHKLKLFAQTEGDWIRGRVYFVGGAGASGAEIRVQDAAGQVLAELTPDASGQFAYQILTPMHAPLSYQLIARTGDGHVAHWTLTAVSETAPSASTSTSAGACPAAAEIAAECERIRFRDVLGGIGYIFGLTGLLLWWRGRRRADRAA